MRLVAAALLLARFSARGGTDSTNADTGGSVLRRAQEQQPAARSQGSGDTCALIAANGHCPAYGNLCPDECGASGAGPAPTTAGAHHDVCTQLASRGELMCAAGSAGAEMCSGECAAGIGADARSTVASGFHISCPVLLRLQGGCAHDLAHDDPSMGARKQVSDVCPEECRGRSSCAPAALDASLLGTARDSSGNGVNIELVGDACVDQVGAKFFGHGSVDLSMGPAYASDGAFTISFWLLKEVSPAWKSLDGERSSRKEIIFSHNYRSDQPGFRDQLAAVEVSLTRQSWLHLWTLAVRVDGLSTAAFAVNLARGDVPMWAHFSIIVTPTRIDAYQDGMMLTDTSIPTNLAENRLRGDCHWDECAGRALDGSCLARTVTDSWAQAAEGVRRCGDVSASAPHADPANYPQAEGHFAGESLGDPDTGIDGRGKAGDFNEHSPGNLGYCAGAMYGGGHGTPETPAWWRVDLGGRSEVSSVKVWTRTNWCANRLDDATIIVSDTEDFTADDVSICGQLSSKPPPGVQNWMPRTETMTELSCAEGAGVVGRFVTLVNTGPVPNCNGAKGIEMCEFEPWGAMLQPAELQRPLGFRGAAGLVTRARVGGYADGSHGLRGTAAMLQIYPHALSSSDIECVYETGRRLVHNGRMTQQDASECRGRVTTGCTSGSADNSPRALSISDPMVDDGSCLFEAQPAAPSADHTVLSVANAWSRVSLALSYTNPVVICGVITRHSSTAALPRMRNLRMSSSGTWSFDVKAEQRSCHFASAPPTSELISVLVVEAGTSAEGWQAGILRVYDKRWRRVSLLRSRLSPILVDLGPSPAVLSQVQTFDNRTKFVSSRHMQSQSPNNNNSAAAFFLQVQGDGIWCQDNEFYAEYFDSLDLSGDPLATECELDAPNWHWHSLVGSPGIPPLLNGQARTLHPMLFSARWTARIGVDKSAEYLLSSHANKGSRILVDGATVVDSWDECCSTFTSDPVQLSAGYHTVAYEYRSGYTADFVPIDSYAELSWSVGDESFGAVHNSSNATTIADELYADVGWLACKQGRGMIHGTTFEAGATVSSRNLVTTIPFTAEFSGSPHVFGSVVSAFDLASHLRLLEAAPTRMSVALEYDTCAVVFAEGAEAVSWLVIAGQSNTELRVVQVQTLKSDVEALLSIGTALRLPEYFHWRNSSDPCRDRWTGIECRTDAAGTPRIVVLDIHDVDLTNQDIPWAPIGQLTDLEEISLWSCGLTGVIDGASLCHLTQLQVLALRKNQLHGLLPDCMATLPLQLLWLEDNNFHGPLPELSPLGQFLKSVPSLNLRRNRWTPLLATEKQALHDLSGPIGVTTHEHGRDWDFGYSYEWIEKSGAAESHLTAAREESYRQWSAGVPFEGFYVQLDFDFPLRGTTSSAVGIGRDGDFVVTPVGNPVLGYGRGASKDFESNWGGASYVGCFLDDNSSPPRPTEVTHANWQTTDPSSNAFSDERSASWAQRAAAKGPHLLSVEICTEMCQGYSYFGLQWTVGCLCGNTFGQWGTTVGCGDRGANCGTGTQAPGCGNMNAVYTTAVWLLSDEDVDTSDAQGSTCWFTLPSLVPNPHRISELATDRSSQGEAYFTDRFCPGWSSFISAACDPDQEACDKDSATRGNAAFDGGDDMYDIGNLIVTSLMGDCTSDPHDCALGSLRYHADFEPVPTNCFGPDGQYQMAQHDGMWVFFTTNVDDTPLDFMISGNLGSDGSGTVTEFIFDAQPHTGFVKRECGDTDGDPSVNHMIIVDSSQGRPVHSCDYVSGGECTGADSNLDDDIVSGIAPGSHILYLLYSTEGGSCMKEDEHREIFNTATLCIRAADPFSGVNRGQTAAGRLLVEVDVDDAGHILFGGKAPYAGWTRGNPRHVNGPTGFSNALQFADNAWLQLGDTGVEIAGNWTLDCWVQMDAGALSAMRDEGVLVAPAELDAYVSTRRHNGVIELGGAGSAGEWTSSGIDLSALSSDWHRITVTSQAAFMPRRSYFVDSQLAASTQMSSVLCDDVVCPANLFSVGNRADGTAPFPFSVHRLRIAEGVLRPDDLATSGSQPGHLLRYQPENSRSIKLSRGTDALEVTWDTFGWDDAVHDHVHASLESTGGARLRCDNVSRLWDRAVASAGAMTRNEDAVTNWTSAALSSDASTGLFVRYIDSDPCFDLWPGTTCSLSDWPVGTDDCAERLDCDALGWPPDEFGSPDVCGSSSLVGEFGSSDMCVRERSYDEAASLCTEMGGRLCSAHELEQGEGDPSACGYDSIFEWSWVDTPPGACPSSNQSLGMAGGAGAWFSFVPMALSAYHEIQLRTMSSFGGDSFTILGVFDGNGEILPGLPATLHHREDGAMLRWNATQTREPGFVHVTSTAARDVRYTMTVAVPPPYSWRSALSQASQNFNAMELDIQQDGALVDLQFDFPFFGREYRRVWVSSFGMVHFEPPRSVGAPVGGTTYSAVLAAAGEFDLNRAGAHVTVSQRSTEMVVAWHAPLFSSETFSDVGVALHADGSIALDWNRIDLSGGGSLPHGLKCLLAFGVSAPNSFVDGADVHDSSGSGASPSLRLGSTGQAELMQVGVDALTNVTVGPFYGGDVGEGLDMDGEFLFALDLGGTGGFQVGDALFTDPDSTAGATAEAEHSVLFGSDDWTEFGSSPDDDALSDVLRTMIRSASTSTVVITLDGLDSRQSHRMQLLFYDEYWDTKAFDVLVNGEVIHRHFCTCHQGGANIHHAGSYLRYDFTGHSDVTVTLDGAFVDIGAQIEDTWPLIEGITLERLHPHRAADNLDIPASALRMVDDAFLQLPSMVLGASIAVSAWVRAGTLSDGQPDGVGITLFNSFRSDDCGNSDPCRNSDADTLDGDGWFAVGNDVTARRPADLWTSNTIFDQGTSGLFWESARADWVMVTVSVSGREVSVYVGGELHGTGLLTARLPRMLRHNNYVGAAHHVPFQQKTGGITLGIADFRLYDRSLSSDEVSALFTDLSSECCISAGLKDAFGVNDLDLTAQAMDDRTQSVAITPTTRHTSGGDGGEALGCASDATAAMRDLDICGEITTVTDCDGVISDGVGPYAPSLDCELRLEGFIGSTYTLTFDEFETEAGVDLLRVYDGDSAAAPLLGEFSGKSVPTAVISTGRRVFVRFTTNDNTAAVGFTVSFSCAGTPVEYWKPSDVAMPLTDTRSAPVQQSAKRMECLGGVLMSVQCCADATQSCASSRVTRVGLSGKGLRGHIPDAVGDMGALRSLKLHDNFLTGTLPLALGRLHLLRELQMSHNQFDMQDRESLSAILGGLLYLKTLDMGMSDEKVDLTKTIVQPTPPLNCRVGEECSLVLSTRTADGSQLPHGGRLMTVDKKDDSSAATCECTDQMDGTYSCVFPAPWTSRKGTFDFVLSADSEEFVPLRTLIDPTSGAESTVETYAQMGVVVPPIVCQEANSFPNAEGAACMCAEGYFRSEYEGGGWSCERCVRGEMPVDEGTRCESCPFGRYSSSGQGCEYCPAGQEPNRDIGADDCVPCNDVSISTPGSMCERCSATEQVADPTRTKCVCPRDTYNSSTFGGNTVQCLADYHLADLADIPAATECMPCSGLPCAVCDSGELKVSAGWSVSGSEAAPSSTPWFIFHCPEEKACPNREAQKCRDGHTGQLCNVCEDDFGMIKGLCERCTIANSSPWTLLIMLGIAALLWGLMYACRQHGSRASDTSSALEMQLTDNPLQDGDSSGVKRQSLSLQATVRRSDDAYMLVRVMYQPIRILIGYGQVVNQIDVVLAIDFPPMIKSMFNILSALAINIKSLLAIDCLGDLSFYQEWTIRVFVIPLLLVGIAALRFAYVRHKHPEAAEDAAGSFRSNVFVIIFLVYPGVCNEAFSMLNCRNLDGGLDVLRLDYRIECNTTQHSVWQGVAVVLIALFSVGIPVYMVVLMMRRISEYSARDDSDRFVARRVADELKIDDKQAAEAIRDVSTGREYSFLVNSYKPRYYYWEGVDMVRKLLLVGMLVVAGRGSAAQLFLAVLVSCLSLSLQLVLQPYKHREDNVFKVLVEVHIFLVVTVSLVLKFLSSETMSDQEVLNSTFYDWILVASFVAGVPLGFVWAVCAKRSMMRASLRERAVVGDDEESSLKAKQRAIRLLHLGLTTNDDMRLLGAYFGRLENMVNKWSHVFVSYRVASDRELARRLYDELSAVTIEETGQKLRVYLDQERLEDGQRWDSGFMEGLAKSWVFVPIVSVGSVRPMTQLSDESDWCDNVLLEWTAALELHQRGRVKSVLPLLASQGDFFADAQDGFGGISALSTHVSAATMEQVTMHLQETTGDSSVDGLGELLQQASGQPEPTVQAVVQSLLKFQGIKVTESGAGVAHSHGHLSVDMADLSECVGRVRATVSACLKRVGMDAAASSAGGQVASPAVARTSALSRLGSRLASTGSSGKGDTAKLDGGGEMEIQFGGGGGGGGLYLAPS